MTEPAPKKPHWAWPHVVGVALAIVAYFAVYRFTGDSDLFLAVATGAVGIAATWFWLFGIDFFRTRTPPRN